MNDKEIERQRYNNRAQRLLSDNVSATGMGSPATLQVPYQYFKTVIKNNVRNSTCKILEIGSGTGIHTGELLSTGAFVTATDISEASLQLLEKRLGNNVDRLVTKEADMECLPFEDASFDMVTSAGSLSYGDNQTVMNEVYRVLCHGGVFIVVDSLNHNPIYRMNRWIHYCRGRRTASTLRRMPTLSLINSYSKTFGTIKVVYYGSISWLVPLLGKVFNQHRVAQIANIVDKVFKIRKSAFKFVMVVKKE